MFCSVFSRVKQLNFSSQNLSIECNYLNEMEKKPKYYTYLSIEFGKTYFSTTLPVPDQSNCLIPNGFQHSAEILFQGLSNLVFRSKYWDKMPVKLRMKSIFLKENHPKQFRILAIQQQFPSACLNRKFRNEILQTYSIKIPVSNGRPRLGLI